MSFLELFIHRVIFSAHSDFNGDIKVIKVFGNTKFIFGGGVQSLKYDSPEARGSYWEITSYLIKENKEIVRSALILGLGGATIQHFMSEVYPGIKITSVEIDPVIIEVAKKYFDTEKILNHKVIEADSFEVLSKPDAFGIRSKFDVIVVDTHEPPIFSKIPTQAGFLKQIFNLCENGGLVVFSFVVSKDNNEVGLAFLKMVSEYFTDVQVLNVNGAAICDNWLIYGKKQLRVL
ncbi:hypothetical protein A2716_02370 [candidate division WWE3 bacterium RIFCSPHIGHO2_01_FULL_40_23]|uniref:PABS domain-containing protein n=1 Tax=candidate division WWE3 bacterium RIFCSPLOWO2_01_FULL_41_18 TaxID=1802625 RepID=A0A1F4VFT9_UNCKA|nr:MAG: hypothetical protein A2716_02370 [candidate division WWE3 bacterium RIFCSPHIGHO2_01_FULL_40_23]OGC55830.1 MAG: hypothetical protein A3A78_02220 [candidate division WWE3 bacterium RIFCSPLOWO2_01_FULL_41_18]